jgi:hypothetical protein
MLSTIWSRLRQWHVYNTSCVFSITNTNKAVGVAGETLRPKEPHYSFDYLVSGEFIGGGGGIRVFHVLGIVVR